MQWRQNIKNLTQIKECNFLGVLKVTPAIASELLVNNNVNRNLNRRRVELYAKDMRESKWENISDGISLTVGSNGTLLNGQHRLNAIIKTGVSMDMFIFEIKKDTNALLMPFDTNYTRSKAIILGQNNTMVSIVNFIAWLVGMHNISAATIQKFQDSLDDKEFFFFREDR